MQTAQTDSIDLVEMGRVVRRGWRYVIGFTAAGVLTAAAIVLFAPRQFEDATTLIVRTTGSAGGSLLSKLAGGLDGLLSSTGQTPLATEVQILESRAIAGKVVDSLRLQVIVEDPDGIPAADLVERAELPGAFRRQRYRFEQLDETGATARYRVTGKGWTGVAAAGAPVALPAGRIVLRAGELPRRFELVLLDHEDAIARFQKRLDVAKSKDGGEVVTVSYRASDSVTAARAPNLLASLYLARRRTTDRGVNEHRVEFLQAQMDSVGRQLAAAEHELRRFQEASGVLEPSVTSKLQLERAGELRAKLGELDVEAGALDQMLTQIQAGRMTRRQLAAYPTFLRSPAINSLLVQLTELETQRLKLLEHLTEQDPRVVAVAQSIENVEGQLTPIATAYAMSVARQRTDVRQQLDTVQTMLGTLPAAAESGLRRQRDVLRLGQIYSALQAQTVDARLAAISEGGDVRQLDPAVVPKEPAFPRPVLTMALGSMGGLAFGLVAALLVGLLGRWVEEPHDVERVAGVPALRFDPTVPLLMGSRASARTMLVIPLAREIDTRPVAQRLAETALARATSATVLDLTAWNGENGSVRVSETIDRLEAEHDLVIVRLPGLAADVTAAALRETRPVLLVAPAGRVERSRVRGAVEMLERLDIPCVGVVLGAAPSTRVIRAG